MSSDLDDHYPSVDLDSFCDIIKHSGKVKDEFTIGKSTAYILEGHKSISKRTIIIRRVGDEHYDYHQATGIAIKHGFMGSLLEWFEKHKDWKDGGYITPR